MYAQRKSPSAQRNRPGFRPAPIRARAGLAMRRSMNFGHVGDAEMAMRSAGLSLAPMALSDAPLSSGGISVLATCTAEDLSDGSLSALVVPAGAPEADLDALTDVVGKARDAGLPILAFGEGVAATLRVLDRAPAEFAACPAVRIDGASVTPLADADAVAATAASIG